MEVAHTINPVSTPVELLNVPMEQMGLWLYTAPGSGLWYHTGRTLTVADVGDLHCLDLASELDVSGAAAFANGTAGGTATREPTHRAPALSSASAPVCPAGRAAAALWGDGTDLACCTPTCCKPKEEDCMFRPCAKQQA